MTILEAFRGEPPPVGAKCALLMAKRLLSSKRLRERLRQARVKRGAA